MPGKYFNYLQNSQYWKGLQDHGIRIHFKCLFTKDTVALEGCKLPNGCLSLLECG